MRCPSQAHATISAAKLCEEAKGAGWFSLSIAKTRQPVATVPSPIGIRATAISLPTLALATETDSGGYEKTVVPATKGLAPNSSRVSVVTVKAKSQPEMAEVTEHAVTQMRP